MRCHILERAYSKELIRVYLEVCVANNRVPDMDSFLNWIRFQVKNKFVLFVMKIIWVHMLACELYREGCRTNNVHCRVAAEKRMDIMLYQGSHHNYQSATIERDFSRLTMNPRIRRWDTKLSCCGQSGRSRKTHKAGIMLLPMD